MENICYMYTVIERTSFVQYCEGLRKWCDFGFYQQAYILPKIAGEKVHNVTY